MIIARHGEIYTKSLPVRKRFISQLVRNIKQQLPEDTITHNRWRIFIESKNETQSIEKLKKVFGLVSVSPCVEIEASIDVLKKEIMRYENSVKNAKSFAVRVQRITKELEMTSQEIAREVGGLLKDKTETKVNLTNPDFQINIEIYQGKAYLFTEIVHGQGGLPVGTGGNVLSIITNKDDVTAALMMMKRGLLPYFFVKTHDFDQVINQYANGHKLVIKDLKNKKELGQLGEKAIVIGTKNIKEMQILRNETKKLILAPLLGIPKSEQESLALAI